jgi:hypothetical protein
MVSSPYAAEVIKLKFANFPAIEYVTGERILSKNYTLLTIRLVTLFFLILGVSGASVIDLERILINLMQKVKMGLDAKRTTK